MNPGAEASLAEALARSDLLVRLFETAGHRLYLVGGVVRDALTGRFRPGADIDCTTEASPTRVRRIVGPLASAVWTQGERYGTVGCVLEGQAFEITTHRSEHYSEASRKPTVAFGRDLVEDLSRRDFTVNAMAVDARDGKLIDPHGGREDLSDGVLRTPLDPDVAFGDDPLRMLRAARFIAGHGLEPSPAVIDAVVRMRGRMSIVAVERVRDELEKLLLLPDPTRGLDFLFSTGLIEQAAPWLASAHGDTVTRTVASVEVAPSARWAALLVDSPAGAAGCLRAMRCSTALIGGVVGLLAARSLLATVSNDARSIRRFVYACDVDVDSALDFARGVAVARHEPADVLEGFSATLAVLRREENVDMRVLPLTGYEVMAVLGLEPGPEVGRALAHLRELMFEEGPLNQPDAVAALQRWSLADYCAEP